MDSASNADHRQIRKYVVPYIKEKSGADVLRSLKDTISTFMVSAERVFGHGHGSDKKQYVIDLAKEIFQGVDEKYISAFVEGLMTPLTNNGLINIPDEK